MRRKLFKGTIITIVAVSVLFNSLLLLAVYTDFLHFGRLTQTLLLLKGRSLAPISFGAILDGATSGMVKSLKDPYSIYLSPEKFDQFREQMEGNFGGVGLVLDTSDESQLRIVRVLQKSPADRAGIKKGDSIIAVDGKMVKEIKATPAADLMRGQIGTKVNLTVLRTGVKKEYSLKREVVNLPSVEGKLLKIPQQVAYIKINTFNSRTTVELEDLLSQFGTFQGAILDLRDNTGGTLETAIEVANNFVPKGPVVHLVDKTGKRETYEVGGGNLKVPLMVLVNGETASASEILAGAIQDTASGLLIGSKTYGKGVVQTIYELGDSSALKITSAKYLTTLGRDINKQGITPDILLEDKETEKGDQILNKAIQLLEERI